MMIRLVLYLVIGVVPFIDGLPVSSDNGNSNSPSTYPNAEYLDNDMIIPPRPRGVAAIPVDYYRWPNGTVPYDMTSTILPQHQTLIVDQMRAMENMTRVKGVDCLTFRPKTASDTYFIIIKNGSGCSGTLGYNRGYSGNRTLNLLHTPTVTCMVTGTIQHELLHVLGFYHEQSRPDRDNYVSIQWSNIQSSSQFNFDKYNYTNVDTQQTPYDYGSVMHYDQYAFAINSSVPTIIPTQNATAYIGQRIGMSPIDILEVQKYYGCLENSTTTTAAPSNSNSSAASTGSTSAISTTEEITEEGTGNTGQTKTLSHLMTYLSLFLSCLIRLH